MRYELFSEQWLYGVVFWNGNDRYEVIHNHYLGNRLLININVKGNMSDRWADIPFNPKTMEMIPNVGALHRK